jgi:hypothetical protein
LQHPSTSPIWRFHRDESYLKEIGLEEWKKEEIAAAPRRYVEP